MDLGLADRTYAVTGGSSGVGLATVRALLDEGANVATCGRDADRLKKLGTHERLFTATCDVRDADAVRGFVAASAQAFDGRRIDGLVNNAGQSRMKRLDDTTEDDWRDELELKFAGVLNPLQAAREYLRASDAASVVNVNAVLAKQPEPRLITTSAARAGILNLSKSLSQELASDGIRVNSVCLGLIDTGQWTRRRRRRGLRDELRGLAGGTGRRPRCLARPSRPRRGGRVRDRRAALAARLVHHRDRHRRLRRRRPRHPLRSSHAVHHRR